MNVNKDIMAMFFADGGLERRRVEDALKRAVVAADDGDAFFERHVSESLTWDDGVLRSSQYETRQGFSLRAVSGEYAAMAHGWEFSNDALERAADVAAQAARGRNIAVAPPPPASRSAYPPTDPVGGLAFAEKLALLQRLDAFARSHDSSIGQIQASLLCSQQTVLIMRADGFCVCDQRPLTRLNVRVTVARGRQVESGAFGGGGRGEVRQWLNDDYAQNLVKRAASMAITNLDAVAAPAGETTVVLAPGWPGILLHEAVGHGLEGDFNRKKTSAFAGLMGERIAASGVTVVDDATCAERRGSLTVDDEGVPGERTVLIEDGRLVGFMQDRQNARLMGARSTGNGRRQSYAHSVMPRMTNTFMLAGKHNPEEIIRSVDKGLYAVYFGGGQVDITSGKFVFSASQAFLIDKGRIAAPVRGATLIGNGADALTRIAMIGDDMALDEGVGTCGKDGQLVPVGVGQPTLRLDRLTVGGVV